MPQKKGNQNNSTTRKEIKRSMKISDTEWYPWRLDKRKEFILPMRYIDNLDENIVKITCLLGFKI